MVFGLEQEDGSFEYSHGAGTSSPSHLKQVEEEAPKPVVWMMCFLLTTLVMARALVLLFTYHTL